ncbi:hypothetical protein GJAV_G00148740 [Gymnothorax javanicus]|nr:hypothetical protein GJAV_G00148740 [Gymnothorax javanicus]
MPLTSRTWEIKQYTVDAGGLRSFLIVMAPTQNTMKRLGIMWAPHYKKKGSLKSACSKPSISLLIKMYMVFWRGEKSQS